VRQAFDLDGVTAYVEAPDSAALDFGSNDFGLALAANYRSVRSSTLANPAAVLVAHDTGTGAQSKWFFALGGGVLNFHLNGPGIGPRFLAQTPFNPASNVWYHLSLTRSNGVYRIFTNGVQASSEAAAVIIPEVAAPITFGEAEGVGFMDGLLDEVIIVSRALTGELAAIRASGARPVPPHASRPSSLLSRKIAPMRPEQSPAPSASRPRAPRHSTTNGASTVRR
jgi:hypothetical protein